MDFGKVLYVGPACRYPKGGVASVLYAYSTMLDPFIFVATTKGGNAAKLLCVFVVAFFQFLWKLCNPTIKIVHLHGASNGSFWRKAILICFAKLFRKKIVYHIHGGGFKVFSKKHAHVVPYILKKCDVIVALSEHWKEFFEKEMKCKNVVVIPNVIEEPEEDHSFRKDDVCNFLFLGKICKEKGIFDLMDVLWENKNIFRNKLKLYVGGNGDKERLQGLITKYDIGDMVEYAGFVSGERKRQLLNNSHVYILPSYIEGLPISILEAMSYHLPVISTNVGGIPEILRDDVEGYIIEAGNKTQLKDAILKMVNMDDERLRMGERAFQTCRPYMPEKVKKELSILYSSLI